MDVSSGVERTAKAVDVMEVLPTVAFANCGPWLSKVAMKAETLVLEVRLQED